MKIIDLFFCLIYRIGIELYVLSKKESKILAFGFLTAWSVAIAYDCYLLSFQYFDSHLRLAPHDLNIYLIPTLGCVWWLRYYKCKKSIIQNFEEKYQSWHPDNRELYRIITIIVLIVPYIILLLI